MEADETKIEYINSKKIKHNLLLIINIFIIFILKSKREPLDFIKISKFPSLIKLDINQNIIKYEK